ncbi:interleukin-17 receptor C isoform X1 [Conger conger]|uniref:interleukin-17 receptor C isoform X1 n=1 Tax=Conger conger TaxID=82655 RepID=UPI002A59A08D|nr:interleukin-17 receptor C isoform X1 [Conger conger]
MKCDLGFTYAVLAIYMLTFVVAAEGIPYADVNTVRPGPRDTGHWEPWLELSTPGSRFVRVQVHVTAKVKNLTVECFDLAESTFRRKSWTCSPKKKTGCKTTYEYDCIKTRPGQELLVTVNIFYKSFTTFERLYKVDDMKGRILKEILVHADVPTVSTSLSNAQGRMLREIPVPANVSTVSTSLSNAQVFHKLARYSWDGPSRRLTISVTPGPNRKTRLCYKQPSNIRTSYSLTANLSFPYLLPCLCVEVYSTEVDAKREKHCPFETNPLAGGRDIWVSSGLKIHSQTLVFKPLCTSASLMPSASLCWRVQETAVHCVQVPNTTLQVEDWRYDVSIVDQHPLMCVQFSLSGSYDVRCPFQRGNAKWEAVNLPAAGHFCVHLKSSIPASFSAQLCVLEGEWCVARGAVHSVITGNTTEAELRVPFSTLSAGLCVQVWRSAPFLIGKRLLCPHSSHGRWGLIAVASVVLVVFVMTLAFLTYCGVRRGLSDWQLGQKPVLLVCSSEQMPQVSAVCALASLLQGELCAGVRMALWAQNTGGVARLGPLPWLFGQCEAVREAGGRVLIAWSPEAQEAYCRWKKDGEREQSEVEKKKDVRNNDSVEEETAVLHRGEQSGQVVSDGQWEPSSATVPILRAALACLQCELQEGTEGHGFALVYFQGLSHSHDIPLELRGVPRYCLPQDFGGLVKELQGGTVAGGKRKGCSCWAGLLSKILALRLAHRLRMWLPQRPLEGNVKGVTVKLPWQPEREERPFRLARLPLPWLWRERTAQTAPWEKNRLTISTQKSST